MVQQVMFNREKVLFCRYADGLMTDRDTDECAVDVVPIA
jgi:hypothetical protein